MIKKKEENEEELFNRLLENIDRQLEIDTKLKELMELLFENISKSTKNKLIEEKVLIIRNLYVDAEVLQAEGRAIFHRLFGTGFEY